MKRFNRILTALLAALMFCGLWTAVAEMDVELEIEAQGNSEGVDPEGLKGELDGIAELPEALEIGDVGLDDLNAEITVDENLLGGGTEAERTGAMASNSFTDGNYNDYEFKIDRDGCLYEYNGDGGNVVIPDGVTSIGDGVFRYRRVTSVTIPDSVTSIGDEAFKSSDLRSLTIPNSVTSIGKDAFSYTDITSIVIPESVTYIGKWFSGCTDLTKVTIHNNVTSIFGYAFCLCDSLENITIPSSVSSIGHAAFWDCGLDTVIIYAKRISIDDEAFMQSHPTFYTYCDSDVYKWAQNRKYDVVDISEGALSETSLAMEYGDTSSLKAYAPEGCTVTWSSSDDTVATVMNGKVTACKEGTCLIYASLSDGHVPTCEVTVSDPAKISETALSMDIGETHKLKIYKLRSRTITWSSSNKKIATVKDGMVTAIKAGTCTITATLSNGKVLKCDLTVKDNSYISKTKLSVNAGMTYKLEVYNLGNRKVTWSSSNKKVATVKDGKVTAIKSGKCTITAKVKNGKTLTCKVTVKDVAKLTKNKLTMKPGDAQTLKINGLNNRKVTWSSSDKNVATVKDGKVKGVGIGKCTITAQIEKGKKLTCKVTVIDGATLSKTELTLLPGQTSKLSVSGVKGRNLTWSSSNKKVATVERGKVTAVAAGKCNIIATVGETKLVCKVTVQKPLTGDIHGILGKDRVAVNKLLPDKLRYYDDDAYTNDFFLVQTSYSDKIISIALLTDAESDIGKYTLYGLYPGMGYDKAKKMLTGKGWKLDSESYDKSYFYNPKNDRVSFFVTIENEAIDLVVYMYKD